MTLEELKNLEENYKHKIIDVFEFLALIPDKYIPNKEDLIQIIKEKNNGNNNSDL